MKKNWKLTAKVFIAASVLAVVLSAIGYLGSDIWLASTQWLLVAAVLAAFGVFSQMNA